jgi:outer membrane lipoprotein-sorting protein
MRSNKWITGSVLGVALAVSAGLAQEPGTSVKAAPTPLTADEVVRNMEQKNHQRAEALQQFQSTRVYTMQYRGFPSDKSAEMTVNVTYQSPNKKEFTTVSQSGSKFIIDHVFKKLLEGEKEAADQENQRRTALSKDNYEFQMDGMENTPAGAQYILDVTPKSKNKFLYRGKIWVDAKDFAVTRIKAEPAKNPSFWIKKTDIEHKYEKVDDFWLPAENHSESDVRLGGRAVLTIEYKDYKVLATRPLNAIPGAQGISSFIDAGIASSAIDRH